MPVFLIETKASISSMEKYKYSLGFQNGLIVPSEGKSGGLALLWKQYADVLVKSCSNSHIDVVVLDPSTNKKWRAIGFYGHPNASQCHKSCQLLNTYSLAWIYLGWCLVISIKSLIWKKNLVGQRETPTKWGPFVTRLKPTAYETWGSLGNDLLFVMVGMVIIAHSFDLIELSQMIVVGAVLATQSLAQIHVHIGLLSFNSIPTFKATNSPQEN